MAVGDHSNLTRVQPRHAAVAAGSPARQHANAVARAAYQINIRRRLPVTQQVFNQRRLSAR